MIYCIIASFLLSNPGIWLYFPDFSGKIRRSKVLPIIITVELFLQDYRSSFGCPVLFGAIFNDHPSLGELDGILGLLHGEMVF